MRSPVDLTNEHGAQTRVLGAKGGVVVLQNGDERRDLIGVLATPLSDTVDHDNGNRGHRCNKGPDDTDDEPADAWVDSRGH